MNKSVIVNEADPEVNSPVIDSNPSTDQGLMFAKPVSYQTPTGQGVMAGDPRDAASIHEVETSKREVSVHEAPIVTNVGSAVALLNHEDSEQLHTRWNEIQGKFVDEPRLAVQQADALVAEVIDKITEIFSNEHSLLEGQWKQGEDVSTEDLRKALQHYRSFFNRLVV